MLRVGFDEMSVQCWHRRYIDVSVKVAFWTVGSHQMETLRCGSSGAALFYPQQDDH